MLGTLLVVSAAAAATSPAPAQAAQPVQAAQISSPIRPGDASLGSTIAAHEGAGPESVAPAALPKGLDGLDVSSHQGNVDWASVYANGGRFVWAKATEGTTYTNPYFAQQYGGAYDVGMVHGAYHFATPNTSSGTAQADFFVDHGGSWTADGRTMPPMLDIEYNPYGSDTCYGLTPGQMRTWVGQFVQEVRARTTRNPSIFTTAGWWNKCTGSAKGYGFLPLVISHWNTDLGPLPAGWSTYRIWQYSPKGRFPGQMERYPGWMPALQRWARGS